MSKGAWIDVMQNAHALTSNAFSGARGCDSIAKSVKFELAAAPFIIEISGTTAHAIAIVVTSD